MSDIDDVLLEKIRKLCVEKHYKYGLGVPLRRDLHIDFHVQYGYGNNTYEQFLEFTQDYKKSIL
ncbi:hypothetical protein DN757_02415 [Paenibacillus silvae]|uniref:Uncharacterized protein n=1 Tax=Paenibacillus silvae TaxID=1325358 RepID=A0A2W6NQI4_9BACL|nr:hypothetical protein DN757_02415 [Paenibacillus silvae]